jgi:hypothetical protein
MLGANWPTTRGGRWVVRRRRPSCFSYGRDDRPHALHPREALKSSESAATVGKASVSLQSRVLLLLANAIEQRRQVRYPWLLDSVVSITRNQHHNEHRSSAPVRRSSDCPTGTISLRLTRLWRTATGPAERELAGLYSAVTPFVLSCWQSRGIRASRRERMFRRTLNRPIHPSGHPGLAPSSSHPSRRTLANGRDLRPDRLPRWQGSPCMISADPALLCCQRSPSCSVGPQASPPLASAKTRRC